MNRILEHRTPIPPPVSIILAYPALDFNFTSWMSPANLRVLRTEQSEARIPGLIHGKDHMRHKSPLSVVNDVKKRPRARQRSWGEAIASKIPVISAIADSGNAKLLPTSPKWSTSLPRTVSKVAGWIVEDTSDTTVSDEEDSDAETVKADSRKEAEKALHERVKTPGIERGLDFGPLVATPVDEEMELLKTKRTKIGTRLTMTSRVGYFQDRIISPSMMRAMAILYIGPRRNPDFETDYYISPLLSPPHLLAHFPPIYLICGERDPFVDDTVIFAGKVREAKRRRRSDAEMLANKSARHGEGLRMTAGPSSIRDRRDRNAQALQDHILRESDDDWVQMRVIEGWGHGFMQMASLMKEVDIVLGEMADWIDESFAKAHLQKKDVEHVAHARAAVQASQLEEDQLDPAQQIPPPHSTQVKPARAYKSPRPDAGEADLGDDEGVVSFTPKGKKKPPPSNFFPVPRRASKENLSRISSAPRFDLDETGSSGEAMSIRTPPLSLRALPHDPDQKGSGAFAFFNPHASTHSTPTSDKPGAPITISRPYRSSSQSEQPELIYGPIPSGRSNSATLRPNSLMAAAVAGARAASPALAAAGLVPQQLGNVSEAELMRRRRVEAVFGMGETDNAVLSDEDDDDEEHSSEYRS